MILKKNTNRLSSFSKVKSKKTFVLTKYYKRTFCLNILPREGNLETSFGT